MGAKTKRARKVRASAEFDLGKLKRGMSMPKGTGIALTSWTLAEIFNARDAQMRGDFRLPARLAESVRTSDALAPAFDNRLAPQRSTEVEIVPAKGARALSIAAEAEALFGRGGIAISADTSASVHACLVNHAVAFAQVTPVPREDGSRVDYVASAWPIENVRWDVYERCFKTRIDPESGEGGGEIPIVHGDGRWIIFQDFEIDPFKHAALLSVAGIWGRHAYAVRDWAKSSVAHGNVKMIGTMPEGAALQDADGNTAEASAMIDVMRDMVNGENPVALLPFGATAEFVAPAGTNYQVFSELVAHAESASARVYLGTDGTMGSKGGAPGVDVQAMFGVALTKVQGDLACLSRGWQTGLIEPWAALNFGTSELAPTRRYMLPDQDADAEVASRGTRRQAFFADIDAAKRSGALIDQAFVDEVAAQYDVKPFKVFVKPAAEVAPAAPASALRAV